LTVKVERAKLSFQKIDHEGSDQKPATGIYLVGAGVVGAAIVQAHLDAGVSIWIADQDEAALAVAIERLRFSDAEWQVSSPRELGASLMAVEFFSRQEQVAIARTLVIESIPEKLDIKRAFFEEAEEVFGDEAVLCTNTSTLSVSRIADSLKHPERFLGMHFFMPVHDRPAVEVIAGKRTEENTIQQGLRHVERLGKWPLRVGDSPGFVVNRLLSPYLNEAMLLLCRGVSAKRIEDAALAYGMPISPLELIDWIGTPTMFDAGRAFWQAFPERIDPAPILVAMIKNKRFGRATSKGFYDYENQHRSSDLADQTFGLSEKYRRDEQDFTESHLLEMLTIPMWIEASLALRAGVIGDHADFDLAMRGGLGFDSGEPWHTFFDAMGSQAILAAVETWATLTKSMNAPFELRDLLSRKSPTDAMIAYGGESWT